MVAQSHKKHTKLKLRESGNYAPNEIAVLGASCNVITILSQNIAEKLYKVAKIGYLDASHNTEELTSNLDQFTFNDNGSLLQNTTVSLNKFNDLARFSAYDLLLINGNHYQAKHQIVILDSLKVASIEKRINQITEINFLIKLYNDTEIFQCLKDKFPNISELPVYNINDILAISNHIKLLMKLSEPPINGLVLAGGKSVRMGTDKGLLNYNGMAQRDYAIKLLQKVLGRNSIVYLSSRIDQNINLDNIITDKFLELGPFGGICSAFMFNPNNAYLVLATDLPYINEDVLKLLISKRNPAKIATAIKGKNNQFMEPLITIWEPKAYPILLSFLAQGYSCPRKVLINSDIEILEVDDAFIRNINTPEEFNEAQKLLNR